MPRVWLVASLIAATTLAGCTAPNEPDDEGVPPVVGPDALDLWSIYLDDRAAGGVLPAPRIQDPGSNSTGVVVAVIDSGVDPFHERFARPDRLLEGSSPVAATDSLTGEAPIFIPVPLLAAEGGGTWAHEVIEPRTLYRFAGTNLLYYSVDTSVKALDVDGHGTGTAGLVAETSPEATLVVIQAESPAPAIEWATAQPWIDVLSISWGCPANCAGFYPLTKSTDPMDLRAITEATRAAAASGKVVVFSAGNDPTVHVTDQHDGPPWIVSVGGADPYRRGEVWMASKAPDVVANYTGLIAVNGTHEGYAQAPGTSFAAPVVAGAVAEAVRLVRERTGHAGGIRDGALVAAGDIRLTNADFRHALNQSAVYWTTTDYDPTAEHPAAPPNDPLFALDAGVPINPAAPWSQMGWGYVDRSTARTMADGLITGALPEKPPEAKMYRDQVQTIRAALWE